MTEPSCIAGYPNLITDTMYRKQDEYAFVDNVKAQQFVPNPNFKIEPEGPFIQDYYKHYEANKPYINALYSPVVIQKEKVNRQCNPLVAYPFGVPHKYPAEKCSKCKGNRSLNKKHKKKKSRKLTDSDFFTSPLKNSNGFLCFGSNQFSTCHREEKNEDMQNLEVPMKKSVTSSFNMVQKVPTKEEGIVMTLKTDVNTSYKNLTLSALRIYSSELAANNNNPSPCKTISHKYLINEESVRKSDRSCNSNVKLVCDKSNNELNVSPKKSNGNYSIASSNPLNFLNDLNSNTPSNRSYNHSGNDKPKKSIYIQLNSNHVKKYSNMLSSDEIIENEDTSKKSMNTKLEKDASKGKNKNSTNKKKIKNQRSKSLGALKSDRKIKKEGRNISVSKELLLEKLPTKKVKNMKEKKLIGDGERSSHKTKKQVKICDDDKVNEYSKNKSVEKAEEIDMEIGKPKKKKENAANRRNRSDLISPRDKGKGETYLRICKLHQSVDDSDSKCRNSSNGSKRVCSSDEDLFDSNISSNVFQKSRIVYSNPVSKRNTKIKNLKEKEERAMRINKLASPKNVRNSLGSDNAESITRQITRSSVNYGVNTNRSIKKEENNMEKKNKTVQDNSMVKKKTKEETNTLSKRINTNVVKNKQAAFKNASANKNVTQNTLQSKSTSISRNRNMQKNSTIFDAKSKPVTPKYDLNKLSKASLKVNSGVTNNRMTTKKINNNRDFLNKRMSLSSVANNTANKKKINNKINNNTGVTKEQTARTSRQTNEKKNKEIVAQENNDVKKIKSVSDNEEEEHTLTQREDINEEDGEDESRAKMRKMFSRSETKLYASKETILPFKTTEVSQYLEKDVSKVKGKTTNKAKELESPNKKKAKEFLKKKIPSASDQNKVSNSNIKDPKGKIMIKKKKIYENILSITKNISMKKNMDNKNSGLKSTGKTEEKNVEVENNDVVSTKEKLKRVNSIKSKKVGTFRK